MRHCGMEVRLGEGGGSGSNTILRKNLLTSLRRRPTKEFPTASGLSTMEVLALERVRIPLGLHHRGLRFSLAETQTQESPPAPFSLPSSNLLTDKLDR